MSRRKPRAAKKLSKKAAHIAKSEVKQIKKDERLAKLPRPLQSGIMVPILAGAAIGFWAGGTFTEIIPLQFLCALILSGVSTYAYWVLYYAPMINRIKEEYGEDAFLDSMLDNTDTDDEGFDPIEEAERLLAELDNKHTYHQEASDTVSNESEGVGITISGAKFDNASSDRKAKPRAKKEKVVDMPHVRKESKSIDYDEAIESDGPTDSNESLGYNPEDLRVVMMDVLDRYTVDDVNAIEQVQSALGMVKFKCVVHTESNEYRVYNLTGNLDTGKGYLEVIRDGSQEPVEELLRLA